MTVVLALAIIVAIFMVIWYDKKKKTIVKGAIHEDISM